MSLLSALWHVQAPDTWPTYYKSARDALAETGVVESDQDNAVASYFVLDDKDDTLVAELEGLSHVELLAKVLALSFQRLWKRGLDRGYRAIEEDVRSPRGQIDVPRMVARQLEPVGLAACRTTSSATTKGACAATGCAPHLRADPRSARYRRNQRRHRVPRLRRGSEEDASLVRELRAQLLRARGSGLVREARRHRLDTEAAEPAIPDDAPDINLHLQNLYEEGELDPEATIKSYLMVRVRDIRATSRAAAA
ncbi:MAG TPA: hypothetical protein VK607_17705 [Kofleriaceae bacterium]|nr:hypothetical protein [Kofleriaceae bacterium]